MTKTLTFLHTSPVHIATFDGLLAELAPHVPARHLVDESLLREARAAGMITLELEQRIAATVSDAIEDQAAVVLCTCSTIGGCAEEIGQQASGDAAAIGQPHQRRRPRRHPPALCPRHWPARAKS